MLKQDPLASHGGKNPNQRGSIVNIASQLALVARPTARECYIALLHLKGKLLILK